MKMDIQFSLTGRQKRAIRNMRRKAKNTGDCRLMVRCHAMLMLARGLQPGVVAEIVGVCKHSVKGWMRRVQQNGISVLESKPYPGAKPKLSTEQKEELKGIVDNSPEAAGFDTGVWTGPLVKEIIQKRFGVNYDVSQVRRILNRLGFSVQFPRVRLSKADAEKQKEWLQTELPAIKKSSRGERSSHV